MSSSDSTIQRARKSGNPVIRGNRATFIWQGKTAPHLISDLNGWDGTSRPFKRLHTGPESASHRLVWSCSLNVPRDAYVEYAFYNPVTRKRILDPLNQHTVNNGMGGRNNFFYMPGGAPSPFVIPRAEVHVGVLSSQRVETKWLRDDYERQIYLYRPSGKGPVPLLVVYDGQDYLQRAKITTIVDNLIADRRIQPIGMVFLPHAGRWRNLEYACSDAMLLWLDQVILPLARKRLNLLDIKKYPGAYGVLGASLGGTMALYTGLRMPDVFGRVLSQSGAFTIESLDFAVVDLVKHGHARDINIWMDVGRLDELLEDNRTMHALLKDKGYEVNYREFTAGHCYTAWRDNVSHGLEAMFGLQGSHV
ncbi:MAG TPA: alpha/beta hydrolase-fold protein [Anaerolineales bacterium]